MPSNTDEPEPKKSPIVRLVRALSGRRKSHPHHHRTASAESHGTQGAGDSRPRKLGKSPPQAKASPSSSSSPVSPLGLGVDHYAPVPPPPAHVVERHALRKKLNVFPLPLATASDDLVNCSPASPTRSPTLYTREERATHLAKTREQEGAFAAQSSSASEHDNPGTSAMVLGASACTKIVPRSFRSFAIPSTVAERGQRER